MGDGGTGVVLEVDVEFRLLGPLEIEHDGRRVEVPSAKERALVAALLLRANHVVSVDTLIEELWGGRPPETAKHTLEAHVSRLRGLLASAGNGAVVETVRGGYSVRADDASLDVLRFERLLAAGRRALAGGDAVGAEATLSAALAEWRGDALTGVTFAGAPVEAARLEALRLAAIEARVDAVLALGRHHEAAAELQALVSEHPLHERFAVQLMLALYRCGRQADALDVYAQARSRLVDELGIEPGKELRALQAAVLRQDRALDAPARHAGENAVAAGSRAARRVRRRPSAIAAAVVALVLALVGMALLAARPWTGGGDGVRLHPNTVGLIDPRENELMTEIAVGARPADVALAGNAVWVVNADDRTVSRLDAATRRVVRTIAILGGTPARIAVGFGLVWVSGFDGLVWVIDPGFDEVAATIRVRPAASGAPLELPPAETVAVGAGAVWIADRSGYLTRIDPRERRPVGRVDLGREAADLAFGDGYVWVASRSADEIVVVDPRAMRVVGTVPVPTTPGAVEFGSGSLWVVGDADGAVMRIDARSGRSAVLDVGAHPVALAHVRGSVWVARARGEVVRIDAASNRVGARLALGGRLAGIAAGDTGVWILATGGATR